MSHLFQCGPVDSQVKRETIIPVLVIHPLETDSIVTCIEVGRQVLSGVEYLDTSVGDPPMAFSKNGINHVIRVVTDL